MTPDDLMGEPIEEVVLQAARWTDRAPGPGETLRA